MPSWRADTQEWRVALVGTQPIAVSLYRHWEHIEHRSVPRASAKEHRTAAMRLLISDLWIVGEAQERGIGVSQQEADREFARNRRPARRSERSFKRFLWRTGQTVADLKFRARIDLLSGKLQAVVEPVQFATKWRARTLCAPGFSTPDCGGTLTR